MALFLTSKGVLERAHRAAETNPAVRSSVVLSTAGAAGLVMGKTNQLDTNTPLVVAGVGVGVSALLGLTAIGDGLAGAGATLVGYKYGAKKPAADSQQPEVLRKRVVVRR